MEEVQERKRVFCTKEGFLAIKLPPANKIEAQVMGGIAVNRQKHELIKAELVMNYDRLDVGRGRFVVLKADSGFKPWAREVFTMDGVEFVLCPESEVIAYEY